MSPLSAAATETACDALPSHTENPTKVTVLLEFVGVTFDPSDLYDALNAQWAVVATPKDAIGDGKTFIFRITAS